MLNCFVALVITIKIYSANENHNKTVIACYTIQTLFFIEHSAKKNLNQFNRKGRIIIIFTLYK